jgi:peptide-methionine (S)-S-oxide reductase
MRPEPGAVPIEGGAPRADEAMTIRWPNLAPLLFAYVLWLGCAHLLSAAETKERGRATFAGGCFWCMEPPFDKVPGVVSTTSGFAGGTEVKPTYEQVASGATGHAEVVQVVYDPRKVSYEKLLEVFWRNIDPFDGGGQFCDRGRQYRSAIYYEGEEQKRAALLSRESLEKSGPLPGPIRTEIEPLRAFYPAEPSHQDYYLRNVRQYWSYRSNCGRDRRLRQLWGEPGR